MESLNISGKEFVKASKIARELGYTSDYVGQLCRGGKIDAQLVGRTWYVDKESLINHKENRYKKKVAAADKPKEETGEARKLVPNFYERATKKETPINYTEDESDLIPTLPEQKKPKDKSHKLSIKLADAHNVSIKSSSEEYEFETPEVKKTVFKGDLVVEDIPEVEFEEHDEDREVSKKDTEPVHRASKHDVSEDDGGVHKVNLKKIKTKPGNKEIKRELSTDHNNKSVSKIKKTSQSQSPTNKSLSKKSVKLPVKDEPTESTGYLKVSYLMSATLMACFVVAILLSVESVVYVTKQVVLVEYKFNVDQLMAALYGYK